MKKANVGMVKLGVLGRMLALIRECNGFYLAGEDVDIKKKVRNYEGTARLCLYFYGLLFIYFARMNPAGITSHFATDR
jgi:hypothetical protein